MGCKVDRNNIDGSIKFTQPVLLQSYKEEYDTSDRKPNTPAEAGTVLVKADEKTKVNKEKHTYFQSGVGKLLHMTRWSRPEIQNAGRELARHGSTPAPAHIKAMHRAMEYCNATPDCG